VPTNLLPLIAIEKPVDETSNQRRERGEGREAFVAVVVETSNSSTVDVARD
jgi:hypothetical protein